MAGYSKVSIERHKKSGVYYLRYTFAGERRRVSTRTSNQGQAELARRRMEDLLSEGKDPRIEREEAKRQESIRLMTLSQLWLELKRRHLSGLSRKTTELYLGNLKNLANCLTNGTSLIDLPMYELNRTIINGFIDLRLEQGRKPATVNRDLQFLSTALHFAVDQGYLEVLPVQIKKLREDNRRDVSNIRIEQIVKLLAHLPRPVADICEFLAYTGRRLEEVLSLKIEDVQKIDLPQPHLVARFRVKGGELKLFPLSALAAEVFRRARGSRAVGYVFINPRTGTRYVSIHKVHDGWVRYFDITIVGGQKLCLHDYRRLLATWAAQAGRSTPEIAEALGHTHAGVTGRYTPGREVPQTFFEGQRRIR